MSTHKLDSVNSQRYTSCDIVDLYRPAFRYDPERQLQVSIALMKFTLATLHTKVLQTYLCIKTSCLWFQILTHSQLVIRCRECVVTHISAPRVAHLSSCCASSNYMSALILVICHESQVPLDSEVKSQTVSVQFTKQYINTHTQWEMLNGSIYWCV